MTLAECVWFKALSGLSFTHSLFLWHRGVKSVVRANKLWQQPYQGVWHWTLPVGRNFASSLPLSVSSRITSLLLFICMQDQPHVAAQHNVEEGNPVTQICFVLLLMMFISQFLPLVLSQLAIGSLLEMVNKPAKNLSVPAKGCGITTRHHR